MGVDHGSIHAALSDLARQVGFEPIGDLVEVYVSNSTLQVNKMRESLTSGDFAALKREAHSLKSSSANMGAARLGELCLAIEKMPGITPDVQQMVSEIAKLQTDAIASMSDWKSSQRG